VPQLFKNESEENQGRYHHLKICEPDLERGGKREELPVFAFYEYRESLSGNVYKEVNDKLQCVGNTKV
jgi:hypothetical protein